jgi:nucleoid-associated protein YgaU
MQTSEVRPALSVATVAAVSVVLLRLAWLPGIGATALPHALATTSPTRSLPLVLALVMTGFALWLAATVLVALAAQTPGTAGRWAGTVLRRLAPAAVRQALAVALGLTVLTSTAGAAQAAGPASHPTIAQTATAPSLSLDWPVTPPPAPALNLDRPVPVVHHDPGRGLSLVTSGPRSAPTVPAAQAFSGHPVTVRPGDSLWRIAARALPRGTAGTVIERSWHRWYAANRTVIGPDPSLIQPGQHLTPPAS